MGKAVRWGGWGGARWLALCVAFIAGCGGGGGSDGSGSSVTVRFSTPSLTASSIEGFSTTVDFSATVNPGGQEAVYLGLEDPADVVVDAQISVGDGGFSSTLTLSSVKPAGLHRTNLRLLVCADPDCDRPLPGSPFLLPITYEVLPQIRISAPQPMRRTGQEPAPSQTLDLLLPPAAGEILLQRQGSPVGFEVVREGNRLRVNTLQLPAGQYRHRVTLTGSADPRYSASVDLDYVVEAPPGGERPLRVVPNDFRLQPVQGTVSTHRFRIERPTWTDVLEPVTLARSDGGVVRDLRHLGGDEYEFTVDTSGLAPGGLPGSGNGAYGALIPVRAGEHGGSVTVGVSVVVGAPLEFRLYEPSLTATALSTTADLARSGTVTVPDGAAVTWRASVDQPWVKLLRESGTTGVDALAYSFDPSVFDLPGMQQSAVLSVSVDRPGTLPMTVPLGVTNLLPRFAMAAPGALTGPTATVRVHGETRRETELLRTGVLSVEGATLRSAVYEEDSRFAGSVGMLAVTLEGIVPGRPVTLRADAPLRPVSLTLPSVGPVRLPLGHAVLPRGAWRLPDLAVQGGALVFAGPDTVWRWPLTGGTWGAPRSQGVPGLIDLSLAPDESDLFAILPDGTMALDPVTLQTRRQGRLARTDIVFDARIPSFARALVHAGDGVAFASRRSAPGSAYPQQAVGWLSSCSSTFSFGLDLTDAPCFADPGFGWLLDRASSANGVPLVRSQEGGTVAHVFSSGEAVVYRGRSQQRAALPALPAGRLLVAIDDAGQVMVRDDGVMVRADGSTVDLNALLPAGHVAGAWALRGDGAVVAAYAYRIAAEAGGPRARDAALLLFGTPGSAGAAARGQVVLPDAVGCNTTLASGEECRHGGALQFAPGGQSLFLVGPRGVAAAPAPALAVPPGAAKRTLLRGPAKLQRGR